MIDIQQEKDKRGIQVDRVGVTDLYWPVLIENNRKKAEVIPAKISLLVHLHSSIRGTHMSRLVDSAHFFSIKSLTIKSVKIFLARVQKKLNSKEVYFKVSFPYFRKKVSPVAKKDGYLSYMCKLCAVWKNGKSMIELKVKVPVLTLCPCSLAISEIGAHNQRSEVELAIILKNNEWFDELIDLIEGCASTDLYSVLKRPDEKWVMDRAMTRPRFVEDIIRDIAVLLKEKRINSYEIKCKNFESIHNHNAFAQIRHNFRELFD